MRWDNFEAIRAMIVNADDEGVGHFTIARMGADRQEEQLSSHPVSSESDVVEWIERIASDAIGRDDGLRLRWWVDRRMMQSVVCCAWPEAPSKPVIAPAPNQVPIRVPVPASPSGTPLATAPVAANERAARAEAARDELRAQVARNETVIERLRADVASRDARIAHLEGEIVDYEAGLAIINAIEIDI